MRDAERSMTSIRACSLAITILIVACSSGSSSSSGSNAAGGSAASASCDGACRHYLGCKGIDNADNRAECNKSCADQGYTQEQTDQLQAMSCPEAIAAVEGNGSSSGGSSSSSSSSSSGGSKDCYGCQHDGSSCIYIAPGGGAHSQCDPSCC